MTAWEGDARAAAARIRARALEIAVARNGAYLGQACSSAELLATLHLRAMNRARGDVLVLSPAHYTLALYAMLVELGELSEGDFATYGLDGSPLEMVGGADAPGMLFTTGSLAQGLSEGIGLALARRVLGEPGRVFVLVSDGELQEGQTWEAFLTLAHYELTSVVVLLDLNDSQVDGSPEDVLALEPVVDKLRAFRLDAVEVDGHDPAAVAAALEEVGARPRVVACRTSISRGFPSLASRSNLHFVRFRPGEAEAAHADLERHLAEVGAA